MTSPIERLPVELLDLVAASLNLPACQNLRLTSRRLYALGLSSFANRHFHRVTTTLGSASLDRLLCIARHAHLARAVSALHIRLLYHDDYQDLEQISRLGKYPPPKRFATIPGLKLRDIPKEATLYNDVCGEEYPQCIVQRLTRALKGLGNIKKIKFYTRLDHIRITDAPTTQDNTFRLKCLSAVIDALVASNLQLHHLGIAKGSSTNPLHRSLHVPYPALDLPLSVLQALQPRLSQVTFLTLSIDALYDQVHRVNGWEDALGRLISTMPSVSTLALHLDRYTNSCHYNAAIIRSLARSCRLSHLTSLTLGSCSAHIEDLIAFLTAHMATLRRLELFDIRLLPGSWPLVLATCKQLPKLEGLRLRSLRDPDGRPLTLSPGRHPFTVTLECGTSPNGPSVLTAERMDELIAFASSDGEFHNSIVSAG